MTVTFRLAWLCRTLSSSVASLKFALRNAITTYFEKLSLVSLCQVVYGAGEEMVGRYMKLYVFYQALRGS